MEQKKKVELVEITNNKGIKTELTDGYMVIPIKKFKYKEAFIMAFQDNIKFIATDKRLTLRDYKILIYLLSVMDFENWIRLSQETIANNLGMFQQDISKALNRLYKFGYIDKIKDGRNNIYRFNEVFVWKGKAATRDNLLQLMPKIKDFTENKN